MFNNNKGDKNMKLKDFSATKHFSMHFKRIFGANTTFGDIAKVKAEQEQEKYIQHKFPKDFKGGETYNDIFKKETKQNSTGNLMGSHVEAHLKDQQEDAAKLTKEKL